MAKPENRQTKRFNWARYNNQIKAWDRLLKENNYPDELERVAKLGALREDLEKRARLDVEFEDLERVILFLDSNEVELKRTEKTLNVLIGQWRAMVQQLRPVEIRWWFLDRIKRLTILDESSRRDLNRLYKSKGTRSLRRELSKYCGLLEVIEKAQKSEALSRTLMKDIEEVRAELRPKASKKARVSALLNKGSYKVPPEKIRTEVERVMQKNSMSITSARNTVARRSMEIFGIKISVRNVRTHTEGMEKAAKGTSNRATQKQPSPGRSTAIGQP